MLSLIKTGTMLNFESFNPTKVLFGKEQYSKLTREIKQFTAKNKILIAYGGGSIIRIGLLDKVKRELKDFEIVEFGGIEANPEYDTLMKAVELCRKEQIDFILAVGGGSVIDGIKFVAGAVNYNGEPWDVLIRKDGCVFRSAVAFGTILTLPATGSESNSGAVISNSRLQEKRTMGGPLFFPKFSILDPTLLSTVPPRQVANGIADAYMHTLEQYLTVPTTNYLQEYEAEAVLKTLIKIAPGVIKDPSDYDLAANLYYCANHALNGNLKNGVPTDWSTHMIGHELTALYGIDHARTLAIICPRLYEHTFDRKKEKLERYAKEVWNITGGNAAREAIEKTESFFQSLGIETRLSAYTQDYEKAPQIVKDRFIERNWNYLGENQLITPEDAYEIVRSCF